MKLKSAVFSVCIFLSLVSAGTAAAHSFDEIYRVVREGDGPRLREMFAEHPDDVRQKNSFQMTLLSHLLSPWGWQGARDSTKLREMAVLLLDAGADINALDMHGQNPAYWAAESGHRGILKLLLERGGKPYVTKLEVTALDENIHYKTALHRACLMGYTDIARILIEAGAPIDVRDDNGQTPLEIAKERRHTDLIAYLEKNKPPLFLG